jgi:predicted DNA binding protein
MIVKKFKVVEPAGSEPFIRFCNRCPERSFSFSNGKEGINVELTAQEAAAIQKAFSEGFVDIRPGKLA